MRKERGEKKPLEVVKGSRAINLFDTRQASLPGSELTTGEAHVLMASMRAAHDGKKPKRTLVGLHERLAERIGPPDTIAAYFDGVRRTLARKELEMDPQGPVGRFFRRPRTYSVTDQGRAALNNYREALRLAVRLGDDALKNE